MPIVIGRAAGNARPIVTLLVRPTEARRDALKESGQQSRMRTAEALIDTGAPLSYIQRSQADELELDPVGEKDVFGVVTGDRPELGIEYRIEILHSGVPAVALISSVTVIAINDLSRFGAQILLGQDLLARCLFVYDGPNERFSLAF